MVLKTPTNIDHATFLMLADAAFKLVEHGEGSYVILETPWRLSVVRVVDHLGYPGFVVTASLRNPV
jgi:hypothetical protein